MLVAIVFVLLTGWLIEVVSVAARVRRPRLLVDAQTFHLWMRAGALIVAGLAWWLLGRAGAWMAAVTGAVAFVDAVLSRREARRWGANPPATGRAGPVRSRAWSRVNEKGREGTTFVHTSGEASGSGTVRLVSANALFTSRRVAESAAALLGVDADIVAVVELTTPLVTELRRLGVDVSYPFSVHQAVDEVGKGVGLWSRFPLVDAKWRSVGEMPSIDADVQVGDEKLRVVVVHPLPPLDTLRWHRWEQAHREIHDMVAERRGCGPAGQAEQATVVVGDFNASRWHTAWRDLVRTAGLRPAHALARRPSASWGPIPGIAALIRLDHALLGGPTTLRSVRNVRLPGSDHRGLVVEIGLSVGTVVTGVPGDHTVLAETRSGR